MQHNKKFLQTASDGKNYEVLFYNLDMIISLGYRINSKVAFIIAYRRRTNQP